MKLLKALSWVGMILSVVAHIVSWTSPNILTFVALGIPLQIIAMVVVGYLYHRRVMPLQDNSDLRWFKQSTSIIHALMFLAIIGLVFHTIMLLIGLSTVLAFLLRALSSIWLYAFASGFGYSSWYLQFGEKNWRVHRQRFNEKASNLQADIQTNQVAPARHTIGRHSNH